MRAGGSVPTRVCAFGTPYKAKSPAAAGSRSSQPASAASSRHVGAAMGDDPPQSNGW